MKNKSLTLYVVLITLLACNHSQPNTVEKSEQNKLSENEVQEIIEQENAAIIVEDNSFFG